MQSCPASLRALSSSASHNYAHPNHYFDHPNQFIPGLSALSSSASPQLGVRFQALRALIGRFQTITLTIRTNLFPVSMRFQVLRALTGGTKTITFTTQTNLFLV